MLNLPPRTSLETLFSPGPMTLVSNFFSYADFPSFSQLLAGAIASPLPPLTPISSSKQADFEGHTQNRPVNFVIAHSPTSFTPSGLFASSGFFSPLQTPFQMSHQQALAHVTAQAALSQSYFNNIQAQCQSSSLAAAAAASKQDSQMPTETSGLEDSHMESKNIPASQSHHTNSQPVVSVSKPDPDGYTWRKYGQKQVKGSECPRSYYRCAHVNCPVKKKVGWSSDGHISDILYKGQHNHEPPQLNKPAKEDVDVKKAKNFQAETHRLEEPMAARDHESNQVMTNEEADDEPNPKRRNTEVGCRDLASSSQKTVTESRTVVQTRSLVDLLDDGFKWRKYGQKVVKGNTNPRSYYKCTYAGCNVRKHVQRASSDPTSVVTTYEGRHNHDTLVGRHTRPLISKETNIENDQRPVYLRLKEEEITA